MAVCADFVDELAAVDAFTETLEAFKYWATAAAGRYEGDGRTTAGVVTVVGVAPSWLTFCPIGGASVAPSWMTPVAHTQRFACSAAAWFRDRLIIFVVAARGVEEDELTSAGVPNRRLRSARETLTRRQSVRNS